MSARQVETLAKLAWNAIELDEPVWADYVSMTALVIAAMGLLISLLIGAYFAAIGFALLTLILLALIPTIHSAAALESLSEINGELQGTATNLAKENDKLSKSNDKLENNIQDLSEKIEQFKNNNDEYSNNNNILSANNDRLGKSINTIETMLGHHDCIKKICYFLFNSSSFPKEEITKMVHECGLQNFLPSNENLSVV